MAANPERKIYKNIITVFCSIIFAIIFMEALLWLFLQAPGDYRVKFKQNLPGLKKEIVYSRNHYDFRALSMKNEKKDPRTIRIFCIGASTTMQDNQNTVETWSGILEQRLNNAFFSKGENIEIAAAGSGGDKVYRVICSPSHSWSAIIYDPTNFSTRNCCGTAFHHKWDY